MIGFRTLSIGVAALFVATMSGAQVTPATERPVSREAVFVGKDDFQKALASSTSSGMTVASLGAIRAGDDRITVEEINRTNAAAEGPVSHSIVTEIYYILEGGGSMETGGTIGDATPMLTDGKPTNLAGIGPSVRGTKMSGGIIHRVKAGDVVMIPPGTPHRFLSLDGHVTYIVIRANPGYERGNAR